MTVTPPPSGLTDPEDSVDLRRYFSGTWHLSRRVFDRRAGLTGRFSGTARFTPDAAGLLYEEAGIMAYGAHEGPASQCYRWHLLTPHKAAIHFQDGRFFHDLGFAMGTGRNATVHVGHDCAPDRYDGRYRLLSDNRWWSAWHIAGPRKAMIIINRYRRT